jgi:hypothetical protein
MGEVSFTPRTIYHQDRGYRFTMDRRPLWTLQSIWTQWIREQVLSPTRIESWPYSPVAISSYPAPLEIYMDPISVMGCRSVICATQLTQRTFVFQWEHNLRSTSETAIRRDCRQCRVGCTNWHADTAAQEVAILPLSWPKWYRTDCVDDVSGGLETETLRPYTTLLGEIGRAL